MPGTNDPQAIVGSCDLNNSILVMEWSSQTITTVKGRARGASDVPTGCSPVFNFHLALRISQSIENKLYQNALGCSELCQLGVMLYVNKSYRFQQKGHQTFKGTAVQ